MAAPAKKAAAHRAVADDDDAVDVEDETAEPKRGAKRAKSEDEGPTLVGPQDGETVTFTALADFGPAYFGQTEVHLEEGEEYTVSADIAAWLEHDGYVLEEDADEAAAKKS